MYEILAGRGPFEGETVREMTEQILEAEAPRPSSLTKVPVPRLLESIAMRCISKSPLERVQSCPELVRELQESW